MRLLVSALTFYARLVVSSADYQPLGQGIFIPETNILGRFTGGIPIYKNLSSSCFQTAPAPCSSKGHAFYENTKSFYHSVSTKTDLAISFEADFSLGFTLDVTTQSIAGNSRTVSGSSLNIFAETKETSIEECLATSQLNDQLVTDFKNLAATIDKPWNDESWQDYDVFLRQYGSHVIEAVTYGSSVRQYAFADIKKQYTEKNFNVRTCVDLFGILVLKIINITACSGITQEDIDVVEQMAMSDQLYVRGGTTDTRNKLIEDPTPELIDQFLNEANYTNDPVRYHFRPIWEILEEQFKATPYIAQAENLKYYYMGFLNFHCPYQKDGDQVLQVFNVSEDTSSGVPGFACSLAPEGCHSDHDCHYEIGVYCGCSGASCVQYVDTTLDTGEVRPKAIINRGSGLKGYGCGWKVWGSECECSSESHSRTVLWPQMSPGIN